MTTFVDTNQKDQTKNRKDSDYTKNNRQKNKNGMEEKENLLANVNEAGHKISKFFNCASENVSNASESVTDYIKNAPVKSSIIALCAGYFISSICRR